MTSLPGSSLEPSRDYFAEGLLEGAGGWSSTGDTPGAGGASLALFVGEAGVPGKQTRSRILSWDLLPAAGQGQLAASTQRGLQVESFCTREGWLDGLFPSCLVFNFPSKPKLIYKGFKPER